MSLSIILLLFLGLLMFFLGKAWDEGSALLTQKYDRLPIWTAFGFLFLFRRAGATAS